MAHCHNMFFVFLLLQKEFIVLFEENSHENDVYN